MREKPRRRINIREPEKFYAGGGDGAYTIRETDEGDVL
jgi:hypothetical protein